MDTLKVVAVWIGIGAVVGTMWFLLLDGGL